MIAAGAALPSSGAPAAGGASSGRWALWRQVLGLLGELWAAQPLAALAALALMLLGNARSGVYVIAMGGLIDALAGSGTGKVGDLPSAAELSSLPPAVFWVMVYIVSSLVEQIYWMLDPVVAAYLWDHGTYRVQRRVIERAAAAPLIQFENKDFFDHLQRASSGLGERLVAVYRQLLVLGRVTFMTVAIGIALASLHPALVPLLIAGAVPALWLQGKVLNLMYEVDRAHTTRDRVRTHLVRLLTGSQGAGEIRLFGAAPALLARWTALYHERVRDTFAARQRRTYFMAAGSVIGAAAYAAGLALIAYAILDGQLSVGEYVAVATGALWFQETLEGVIGSLRTLEEEGRFLGNLFEFQQMAQMETPEAGSVAPPHPPLAAAPALAALGATGNGHARSGAPPGETARGMSVEARGLTFRYPGAAQPALEDVTLHIKRGEKIAIVGENGAGKTTLVKLLVGLYRPDAGTVLLDGAPLTPGSAVDARRRIAAVFQDYATYQLTLRENVGFGDVSRLRDDAAILAAVEAAGADDLLASLPQGCDTVLGRQFGDRELSGGQWQRVALARAFFRDADLLVLDEPTAALDPRAELRLFERFAALVEGRTAIMISHRLGAARLADRVLVVEDGRIVEDGPHDALVLQNGRYAALFAAQAQWYR